MSFILWAASSYLWCHHNVIIQMGVLYDIWGFEKLFRERSTLGAVAGGRGDEKNFHRLKGEAHNG